MSKRQQELAEQFARGQLPEQQGKAPAWHWCDNYRTALGRKLRNGPKSCNKCGGTGQISR